MMNCIDGTEWGADGIQQIAERAIALSKGSAPAQFPGKRVALLFLNSSLRTRASMEAATAALGAYPLVLQPGKDSWALETEFGVRMDGDRPEHIKDAIGVLSGYADLLAVRAFADMKDWKKDASDPVIRDVVKYASRPVINLESALWHPMQGFADAATWIEQLGPDLRGQPITLTWAPHPKALPMAVPNQVLLTASALGMDVRLAHPEGFSLSSDVLGRCEQLATSNGGGLTVSHDQKRAMQGTRVVVAKSWGGVEGYANRAVEAERRQANRHWMVDEESMSGSPGAGFMHCLPVRRNVVVSDAVLDGANSWVMQEAHHRLWTAMAVLERQFRRA